MKTHRVTSFTELHEVLTNYRKDNRWMFRGQARPDWPLLPKAGRAAHQGAKDEAMFEAWKRRAAEFVVSQPSNEWEWLAIAQHHGLATRLLDWTFQPLTAAFFAVWNKLDSTVDSHIYCFNPDLLQITFDESPFTANKVSKYKPRGVAARIVRQGGLFSIHPEPSKPLDECLSKQDKLDLIVIDKQYCKELIFELSHYGVNSSTVFPDLDGLSAHVNWHHDNSKYWSGKLLDSV